MPVNTRAAALRAALERILGEPVHMTAAEGVTRLRAPVPVDVDTGTWRQVIEAVRTADRWGSTDDGDTPEVWAEITEGQS